MMKRDGVLHLIAKYQGAKEAGDGLLPLDSGIFMDKLLIAGVRLSGERSSHRADAAQMLADGTGQGGTDGDPSPAVAADGGGLSYAVREA